MTDYSGTTLDIIRSPKQLRSWESWRKILDAGLAMLEENGADGLSIGEVSRRAAVAPTVIYARVSGLSDLYWAIYDHGMIVVNATVDELLGEFERSPNAGSNEAEIVNAACDVFQRHFRFFRPILSFAAQNAADRSRGSVHARKFVARLASLFDSADAEAAFDVARYVHQENVFRAIFGGKWVTSDAETDELFRGRLVRMAEARLR